VPARAITERVLIVEYILICVLLEKLDIKQGFGGCVLDWNLRLDAVLFAEVIESLEAKANSGTVNDSNTTSVVR
jgi:hypothetical protein